MKRRRVIAQEKKRITPKWVLAIIEAAAAKHESTVERVLGGGLLEKDCKARREAMYRVKSRKSTLSSTRIGIWFGRSHAAVLHGVARHSEETGAKRLYHYHLRDRSVGGKVGRPRKVAGK